MPLRHEIHQLILAGFREHGIDLPFPPFQMRLDTLDLIAGAGRTLSSATKKRQPGGLCKPSPSFAGGFLIKPSTTSVALRRR